MTETPEHRLKRLHMRSMRRGTKEMDILLMRFAEAHLNRLSSQDLDIYEDLLEENDQDLYQWITGQAAPPARLAGMIDRVRQVSAG